MSRAFPLAMAADVLFNHLLSGRRRPFLASFKLTHRCNLRCQQCPFAGRSGEDRSFDQVCQTLNQLAARGDRIVIFEGGEPLLWRSSSHTFADVVAYARTRFRVVGATTNGTLPLDVPTDILWVSVDGFAGTHNRLRGADIFDQVIEAIRHSPHPRLYAHITANAVNHAEIPALVRFLSGMVKGITVQFYYPYEAGNPLLLPWPERRALLQALIRLKHAGLPVLNSTAALRALMANTWRCQPWRVDCADPDGSIWQGCYLLGRAPVDCSSCGFSPYTELSLAFQGHPGAILAGLKIFT